MKQKFMTKSTIIFISLIIFIVLLSMSILEKYLPKHPETFLKTNHETDIEDEALLFAKKHREKCLKLFKEVFGNKYPENKFAVKEYPSEFNIDKDYLWKQQVINKECIFEVSFFEVEKGWRKGDAYYPDKKFDGVSKRINFYYK